MATETLKYVDNNWKISNESLALTEDADTVSTFGDQEVFKNLIHIHNQTMTLTQMYEE